MKIRITILVEPTPKARPRHTVRGGRVITYTPKGTTHAEAMIRETVVKLGERFNGDIPLRLNAIFYRERPKSLPKKVKMPVTRPDWDNYGKLLTDALEKYVYNNDSQITTAIIRKRFGSPPRIELTLEDDNEVPDWF